MIRVLNKNESLILENYLKSVDGDFNVSLSSKINISDYAFKLVQKGVVIAVEEEQQLCGIIGLYINDEINYKGFISILSVKKQYIGKGYATSLVNQSFKLCEENRIKEILVDTVNPIAEHLYKSLGFVSYKEELEDEICKKYLLKKL